MQIEPVFLGSYIVVKVYLFNQIKQNIKNIFNYIITKPQSNNTVEKRNLILVKLIFILSQRLMAVAIKVNA